MAKELLETTIDFANEACTLGYRIETGPDQYDYSTEYPTLTETDRNAIKAILEPYLSV